MRRTNVLKRITAAAALALSLTAGLGVVAMTTTHTDTATGSECAALGLPPSACDGPKGPWEWD